MGCRCGPRRLRQDGDRPPRVQRTVAPDRGQPAAGGDRIGAGHGDRRRRRGVGSHPAVPAQRPRHHHVVVDHAEYSVIRAGGSVHPGCAADQMVRWDADCSTTPGKPHRFRPAGLWDQLGRPAATPGAAIAHAGAGCSTAGLQPLSAQRNARRAGAGFHTHRPRQGADPPARAGETRTADGADPLATLFAYSVGGLVAGAVFVEKIFGWHGMGEWAVPGISTQDTNIVAAITLFSGRRGTAGRSVLRHLLRRARPEGAGVMTTDRSSSSTDAAATQFTSRRTLVVRRFLRNRPAVAALAVLVLLFVGCYALPRVAALRLPGPRFPSVVAAAEHPALAGHQCAGPGSAGADVARDAEVDVDRCLRCGDLDRNSRHRRIDRGIFRRTGATGS